MKFIFLDIDGVMNDHELWPETKCGRILAKCVDNLNVILRLVPDAMIVLSSAWRYSFRDSESVGALLASHGVIAVGRVHGVTELDPEIDSPPLWTNKAEWAEIGMRHRKKLIEDYVEEHEPEDWIAIDDLPLKIDRLVLTNGDVGLTESDAELAFRMLGGFRSNE